MVKKIMSKIICYFLGHVFKAFETHTDLAKHTLRRRGIRFFNREVTSGEECERCHTKINLKRELHGIVENI